jgi:hypothetical protein
MAAAPRSDKDDQEQAYERGKQTYENRALQAVEHRLPVPMLHADVTSGINPNFVRGTAKINRFDQRDGQLAVVVIVNLGQIVMFETACDPQDLTALLSGRQVDYVKVTFVMTHGLVKQQPIAHHGSAGGGRLTGLKAS